MNYERRDKVIYRNQEPQFVIEKGPASHSNCVALIPMKDFTRLLDEEGIDTGEEIL